MLASIHPFPARMAPEIAFEFLGDLPKSSVVLDPMCGSGVSLRSALESGHQAIGNDADPLAVLMSKVWTEKHRHSTLADYAGDIIQKATHRSKLHIPWHSDVETKRFVEFWFGSRQRKDLSRLALAIHEAPKLPPYIRRALRLALSRIIVTKTRGASLAWDVAHSRPHRKKMPSENDFDVMDEFQRSCDILAQKLYANDPSWICHVLQGDARKLRIADNTVDAVITSPPYLNAIDYLRGHRLSLIWLGYSLPELRVIRGKSIGTECTRRPQSAMRFRSENLIDTPTKAQRLAEQFLRDIGTTMREIKRVAKPRAKVCIITANSKILGTEVRTNSLVHAAAEGAGLSFLGEKVRLIEKKRRYLPVKTANGALKARMMEEHLQYFVA